MNQPQSSSSAPSAAGPSNLERFFVAHRAQLIGAIAFLCLGLVASAIAPSLKIAWVIAFLLLTIYLFAFEVVAVDVAAMTVMVLLGITGLMAPLMGLDQPLVPANHLFEGFSSNAVISIIAVMIIGAGLDKTGIMHAVAAFILKIGGKAERRIIPIVSGTVAFISSFMQNVGAAALFLPVVSRISARTGLPLSRLLMPMGFCAILGGTMTMVGSSPLILLNDLILNSNKALPPDHQMQTWYLFAVTPIGLALVITGIAYFILAGRFILPSIKTDAVSTSDTMSWLQQTYGLEYEMREVVVPATSPLVGKTLDEIEKPFHIRVIALQQGAEEIRIGAGVLARDLGIKGRSLLGVLGAPAKVAAFVAEFGLEARQELQVFSEALAPTRSGIAEVVIPYGSSLIGKSARKIWMRKTYGISMLAIHRNGETLREGNDIRNLPLAAGDTLIVHTPWNALARLEPDPDFVVVTTEYPHEEQRPHKVGWALACFLIALSLVLSTHLRLSISLMIGAVGMILAGVLKVEEAYRAVSWKTVFLLASLIPLGLAVETSGTAAWIAERTLVLLGGVPTWVLQFAIAILATVFTLVMSNVGATVLLVPLAVNIAVTAGADPAVFALTVALATSNSFLIPTHQVNALIMGPAGYRVADFLRAGGLMTLLFLIVMMLMINLLY